MKVLCLLSLFFAIPALAVETAAPADPLEAVVSDPVSCYWGYDEDGDGQLCATEKAALSRRLLRDFDLNGDQKLDENEWLLAQYFGVSTRRFDGNTNGRLEASERKVLLASLRSLPGALQDGPPPWDALQQELELRALLYNNQHLKWAMASLPREEWAGQNPEERQALLDRLAQSYEAAAGGKVDLAALRREIAIVGRFDSALAKSGRRINLTLRKKLQTDQAALFDLNGDGTMTAEEFQEVGNRTLAMVRWFGSANFREFLKPEVRQKIDARMLPLYDLNHNSRWDPEEWDLALDDETSKGQVWSLHKKEFDVNGDGMSSLAEARAFDDWLIKTYDAGTDGFFDPRKFYSFHLEEIQLPGQFPDPAKRAAWRAELLGACDADHNGKFGQGEARVALMLCATKVNRPQAIAAALEVAAAEADRNHDGTLDLLNAAAFERRERLWNQLLERRRDCDTNKDGYLGMAERNTVLQKELQTLDGNGNGRIDLWELQELADRTAYVETVFVQGGGTGEGSLYLGFSQPFDGKARVAALGTALFDVDGDGQLDAGELETMKYLGSFIRYYARKPGQAQETPMLKRGTQADPGRIQSFLDRTLAVYDADGNGRVEKGELQTGLRLEAALLTWQAYKNEAAVRELDADGNGSVSKQELQGYLASLLVDFDTDGDGRLAPAEIEEKLRFEERLYNESYRFPKIKREGGKITAKTRADLVAELVKGYDTNGNGRLGPDELKGKTAGDTLLYRLRFLQPGFETGTWDQDKRLALEAKWLPEYDLDHNGRLDLAEIRQLYAKSKEAAEAAEEKFRNQKFQGQQIQAQRQQDTQWLKRYDLNGNGQLDPDERKRATQETQSGLKSPALEE